MPPGPVTELSYTSSSVQATITWVNPTDPDFESAIVRYAKGTSVSDAPAMPATPTQGRSAI